MCNIGTRPLTHPLSISCTLNNHVSEGVYSKMYLSSLFKKKMQNTPHLHILAMWMTCVCVSSGKSLKYELNKMVLIIFICIPQHTAASSICDGNGEVLKNSLHAHAISGSMMLYFCHIRSTCFWIGLNNKTEVQLVSISDTSC